MPVVGRLRPGASIDQAGSEARLLQSRLPALFPWPMPSNWNADVDRGCAAARHGRGRADAAAPAARRCGAGAWHRVRQCRQPPAVARRHAGRRNGGPRRAWRRTPANHPPAAHRERASGVRRGRAWNRAGRLRPQRAQGGASRRHAAAGRGLAGLAGARVCGALAIAAAMIFGLAPAFHAARLTLTDSLKSGSRGGSASGAQRVRGALVVGEVALAAMLVVASGVLIRSFWNLSHVNPGFRSERVLTMRDQSERHVLRQRGSVCQLPSSIPRSRSCPSGTERRRPHQHAAARRPDRQALGHVQDFVAGRTSPSRCSGSTSSRPTTFV